MSKYVGLSNKSYILSMIKYLQKDIMRNFEKIEKHRLEYVDLQKKVENFTRTQREMILIACENETNLKIQEIYKEIKKIQNEINEYKNKKNTFEEAIENEYLVIRDAVNLIVNNAFCYLFDSEKTRLIKLKNELLTEENEILNEVVKYNYYINISSKNKKYWKKHRKNVLRKIQRSKIELKEKEYLIEVKQMLITFGVLTDKHKDGLFGWYNYENSDICFYIDKNIQSLTCDLNSINDRKREFYHHGLFVKTKIKEYEILKSKYLEHLQKNSKNNFDKRRSEYFT